MQSKIHDKDAITILFILEMTSAAILTCTKRKSTLSYPYVHTLRSPQPHPLEKRLSLYFHYITPHTLLTFGIKMFFDVY